MNLLLTHGKIDHSVMKNLSKLFMIKELNNSEIRNCTAVVFDLSNDASIDDALLDQIKAKEKPIIVINSSQDRDEMSNVFGLGFDSEFSVVYQYEKSTLIIPVTTDEEDKFALNEESFIQVHSEGEVKTQEAPVTKELELEARANRLPKITELLEIAVQEEKWQQNKKSVSATSTPPIDLPVGQYKIYHVPLNRVIQLEDRPQTATNEMLIEVWLIASFNPKRKYVQINTLGAGFHPASGGDIARDDKYGRGHFQNSINIKLEPTNNSRVTTYETSPKNVNGETTYTSSSSFTVGVDISENPGFNASYTIGSSESTTIKDFTLTNNSSGSTGEWDFQMTKSKNSIWDMFSQPFMEKATVKSLPTLAKSNLQPVCTGVWMVNEDSGTFNQTVNYYVAWNVQYYYCWVTGDWVSYKMKYQRAGRGKSTNISVNYGLVNA